MPPSQPGVVLFLRRRWGAGFWWTLAGALLLAAAAITIEVIVDDEPLTRSLIANLGPIAIVLLVLFMAVPLVVAWGLKLQRDEARSDLAALEDGDDPPRFQMDPQGSEKIGVGRYEWLQRASALYELKVDVRNVGTRGWYYARAIWADGRGWNLTWHGSANERIEIAHGGEATIVLALVAQRRSRWDAFGILPNGGVGPRAKRGAATIDVSIEIRRSGADTPHVSDFRLRLPTTGSERPTIHLIEQSHTPS